MDPEKFSSAFNELNLEIPFVNWEFWDDYFQKALIQENIKTEKKSIAVYAIAYS